MNYRKKSTLKRDLKVARFIFTMANIEQNTLPYNPSNIVLQRDQIHSILRKFNVRDEIVNINLYRNALVHRSYCTRKNENFLNGNTQCPENCIPLQEESNERLEFLGDAVINLVIAKYLFERYPDENEGFLTKIRTKLVNGNMLAHLSDLVGLPRYVLISKQIEENTGRHNKKILEDCFEAFVGAMFLDFDSKRVGAGYETIETWLISIIEENIDFSDLISNNHNYKDILLKYYQHNYNYLPKFLEMSSENTNNGKTYYVCLKDKNDTIISTGEGSSKKQAENECARKALMYLGQL